MCHLTDQINQRATENYKRMSKYDIVTDQHGQKWLVQVSHVLTAVVDSPSLQVKVIQKIEG